MNPAQMFVGGWGVPEAAYGAGSVLATGSVSYPLNDHWLAAEGEGPATSASDRFLHYVQAIAPAPVRVVAWSAGAVLALESACRNPSLFRELLLLSPTARFCQCPDYDAGVPATALDELRAQLQQSPYVAVRRFQLNCLLPLPDARAHVSRWEAGSSALSPAQLYAGLDYLRHTDLRTQVRSLNVPVTLMHGSRDRVIPVDAACWLHDHLPCSSLRIWPDAGHGLPFTRALSMLDAVSWE